MTTRLQLTTRNCSFCGKPEKDVGVVREGPGGVRICDECVDYCAELVAHHRSGKTNEDIEAIKRALGWDFLIKDA